LNSGKGFTVKRMRYFLFFFSSLRKTIGVVGGIVFMAIPPAMAAEFPVATPWQVVTLDGARIDSESLKGKVVLVHFWASWCAPCREELPAIEAFYQAHAKDGLEIVAVSLDDDADKSKVRDFVRPYAFPVAMMRDARMDGFGRIWVLPLSILIDRQGRIRKADWTGEQGIDAMRLNSIVLPLLSESDQQPDTH
jgi:thiol-disulfide isomerase/thioredoxin